MYVLSHVEQDYTEQNKKKQCHMDGKARQPSCTRLTHRKVGGKNYGVPLDKIIDNLSFFQILSSYRLVTTISPATEIMIFILSNYPFIHECFVDPSLHP